MLGRFLNPLFRMLLTQRLVSTINIAGLSLGFAASLLIILFIRYEFSYEDWIADSDSLFKIEWVWKDGGGQGRVPPAVIPLLSDHFPEIEETTRFHKLNAVIKSEEKKFMESVNMVDSNFFNFFNVSMVSGNRDSITTGNTRILISETIAQKYFGTEVAEGNTLTIDLVGEATDFTVSGVFMDIPDNSHIEFDFLTLLDTQRPAFSYMETEYLNVPLLAAYARFAPGAEIDKVEAQIPEFYLTRVPLQIGPEGEDKREGRDMDFINVRDVHLFSEMIQQVKPIGDIRIVLSFLVAAIFILVIAAINFTNLSTAQAVKRAKEISLRKVMGANRSQLIRKFFGESIILASIALLIALSLVDLVLPTYAAFWDKDISWDLLLSPTSVISVLAITCLVGLLGGFYPAMVLSGFRPSRVLQSSRGAKARATGMRQVLVIMQFSISIALVISTAVVQRQVNMMTTMDIGIERENKIILHGISSDEIAAKEATIREEMLRVPGVKSAALSQNNWPLAGFNMFRAHLPGVAANNMAGTQSIFGDAHLFEVLGIEIIVGRGFGVEYTSDTLLMPEDEAIPWTRKGVASESFVKNYGFSTPGDIIGQVFVIDNFGNSGRDLEFQVVGVVNDMKLRPMRENTGPLMFFRSDQILQNLILDISNDDIAGTVEAIDQAWERVVPGIQIQRSFMSDDFEAVYRNESRQSKVFGSFSILAIIVSSLGLFGLAVFSAQQRTKEIGIRKTLGARVFDIANLLSWQFVKPVLIANIIAWPVAAYFMLDWLSGFAYRTEISVSLFVSAGLIAIFIAWVTVALHAWSVAKANPIHALRCE